MTGQAGYQGDLYVYMPAALTHTNCIGSVVCWIENRIGIKEAPKKKKCYRQ